MDDRAEERLLEKVQYVVEALEVLAAKRDELSFEEYTSDREQRDIVEREFQTAIEGTIDIGEMLLRARDTDVPETNAETFMRLGRDGILDASTAERMAEAAGFRNILTHRDGVAIDDEDVFNALRSELPIFRDFLEQVRRELSR